MTRLNLAPPVLDLEALPLDGVHGYTWAFQAAGSGTPSDLTGRAARLVLTRPGRSGQEAHDLTGGADGTLRWTPPREWRGPATYALLLADTAGGPPRVILTGTLTHGVVISA